MLPKIVGIKIHADEDANLVFINFPERNSASAIVVSLEKDRRSHIPFGGITIPYLGFLDLHEAELVSEALTKAISIIKCHPEYKKE